MRAVRYHGPKQPEELAELTQAVELVSHGIVTTVVDRTLPLEEFQKGIDALARSEPVGRVVSLP